MCAAADVLYLCAAARTYSQRLKDLEEDARVSTTHMLVYYNNKPKILVNV